MKPGSHHSPESRARIGTATKRALADPAIRERISAGTKKGMRSAYGGEGELQRLRKAWREARPAVRNAFVAELFGPLWGAAT